jgi:hypothetical protein
MLNVNWLTSSLGSLGFQSADSLAQVVRTMLETSMGFHIMWCKLQIGQTLQRLHCKSPEPLINSEKMLGHHLVYLPLGFAVVNGELF